MRSASAEPRPELDRARRVALEAVLAALIVASGRLKVIPGIEWVSLLCLSGGLLLGIGAGIRLALVGEFLYSLTSPYGLAPPLVLVAQLVGMAPAGLAGGLLRRRSFPFWIYGAAGFVTTLWFDACTDLASVPFVGGLRPAFLAGLPFRAVHVGSNVVLFAALGPLLSARLRPFFSSSSSSSSPAS